MRNLCDGTLKVVAVIKYSYLCLQFEESKRLSLFLITGNERILINWTLFLRHFKAIRRVFNGVPHLHPHIIRVLTIAVIVCFYYYDIHWTSKYIRYLMKCESADGEERETEAANDRLWGPIVLLPFVLVLLLRYYTLYYTCKIVRIGTDRPRRREEEAPIPMPLMFIDHSRQHWRVSQQSICCIHSPPSCSCSFVTGPSRFRC